jgi:hypothetical protein
LDEVADVLFRVGSQNSLSDVFGEFYEAMFEDDVSPWELIICYVVHPKKELE